MRKGIKSLLELDRCQEELQRLSHERSAMQEWFAEEWKCVVKAMQSEQNEDVIYQLELHAYNLACLCNTWQDKVRLVIPHKTMDSSWGPTVTSVTHLDQAISLDIFVKTCVVLGPLAIYFFALGRKYIIVLDEKCLTMNILTGNIWVVILR